MKYPSASPENSGQSGARESLGDLLQRPLRNETECSAASGTSCGQPGVAIGRIVGSAGEMDEGLPIVVPVLGEGILMARLACVLPEACVGRECAVLFENGDRTRPLIMGLLLNAEATKAPGTPENVAQREEAEIRVDGERVIIEAQKELELRCGESVILLQADGRIEIRGNYVTSQASASQRIRGGSVHIN